MQNITWHGVVVFISILLAFVIAGLQAIGSAVPDSGSIIAILTAISGIFTLPAINGSVGKALRGASNR